tara:strand:- start:1467 stop:1856 length:390 start_codon:yes stop_codon:yes gene_type:complete
MTAIITPDDIKKIYPQAAGFDDCTIQEYICIVNEADACMAGSGYSECVCAVIKKNAVAHMLYSINFGGISSMTSPTGESISFKDIAMGNGLASTPYGRQVLSLDKSGCVSGVIENTSAERFAVSVGGFC